MIITGGYHGIRLFLKGRYFLIIYVGIDLAKQGHIASLISSNGEILVGPFQFSNDSDGFHYLVSAFEPFDDEEIIIRLESTAHYADNMIHYFVTEGYPVCVLNPLSTSSLWKNTFVKQKRIKSTPTLSPKLL